MFKLMYKSQVCFTQNVETPNKEKKEKKKMKKKLPAIAYQQLATRRQSPALMAHEPLSGQAYAIIGAP